MTVIRRVDPLTGDLVCLDLDTLRKVEVPADEALRLLRQQVGRCPVCGVDLDRHDGGTPCPDHQEPHQRSGHGGRR